MLGVASSLAAGEMTLSAPPVIATVEDDDEVVLAALRTPPHHLIVTRAAHSALVTLVDALKEEGVGLPGVNAVKETAELFARLWAGDGCEVQFEQRIYVCTEVREVADPGGALRVSDERDRPLLVDWIGGFNDEVGLASDIGHTQRFVDDKLASGTIYAWEHDGDVVSIAGVANPTPNGIRVNLVYTPAERRRRGYATACVAALTQRMFDQGRALCFLYTDLANPTSNAIYQTIGYQQVCDATMWRFL